MEYRRAGDTEWTTCSGGAVSSLLPGTYYVRFCANSRYPATEPKEVTVEAFVSPGISGTLTVTGSKYYGKTVTASASDLGSDPGTKTYQWLRNGVEIYGAVGTDYTITAADVGQQISVRLTCFNRTGSLVSTPFTAEKANGPAQPSITFSFDGTDARKLMGSDTAMEYSLDGGTVWHDCTGSDHLLTQEEADSLTPETSLRIRVKETATVKAGAAQVISISSLGYAPTASGTDCTAYGANDGTMTIPSASNREYKKEGGSWTAVVSSPVTNLEPGTYYVRIRATGRTQFSAAKTIVIKAPEATPAAVFTATGPDTGTLSALTAGMEYSVNGGAWTACTEVSVDLTELSPCTIKVRMPGNGTTTLDSASQSISVTKASAPNGITHTDCTVNTDDNGTISGVTAAMEYQKHGAEGWTAGTGAELTGIPFGTYYIRVKASGTVLASDSVTVAVNPLNRTSVTSASCTMTVMAGSASSAVTLTSAEPEKYTVSFVKCTLPLSEEEQATLTAGSSYRIVVKFTPMSGYTFADTASFTVNTTAADSVLHNASPEYWTQSVTAIAQGKEATPAALFTATGFDTGTLTGVSAGMQYSVDGGANWVNIASSEVSLTELSPCTIRVRKTASADYMIVSEVQEISVTRASAPVGVGSVACTTVDNNNGKLTNVTDQMEYLRKDMLYWTTCNQGTTSYLGGDSYSVRVKASGTVLASDSVQIEIGRVYLANTLTGNTLTVRVAASSGAGNVTVAEFDEHGKMIGFQMKTVTEALTYEFTLAGTGHTVKVFLVAGGFAPVCKEEDVSPAPEPNVKNVLEKTVSTEVSAVQNLAPDILLEDRNRLYR